MRKTWRKTAAVLSAGCLLAGGWPGMAAAGSGQMKEAGTVRPRQGLSYTYPTDYADWANGFMSGNGKMGIIVFGNPLDDTVVYNDRGFNKAANVNAPTRTFNEVSGKMLQDIKNACASGDFKTANDLAFEAHGWKDGGDGNRHPGYKMQITIPEDGEVTGYSRVCDFTTGEIKVNWSDNRGDWTRSSFVSRRDNVVVQQLSAPTQGKLTCSIVLGIDPEMKMFGGMTYSQNNTTQILNFRAKYGPGTGDAGYEGVTRVEAKGGRLQMEGDVLKIEGADEVLLLTQTEKYRSDSGAAWDKEAIQKRLFSVSADYDTLLQGQKDTHTAIYNRVSLDYNASPQERALSNEELLARQKAAGQPVKALYERLFDAGRYYFLCSGYEKSVADLGGIWAGDTNAGWGGFYHLDANLNLQMAGGVIGDMPEVMEGYFHLNEAWEEDFKTNARKLLGCRGLLAAGNTPGGQSGLISSLNYDYPYQYVTGEEAWLLYPFWEYYQVTGDKGFLENRLYPLLRQMGDFYEDFLTEKDKNGQYIFAGSISPENKPANLNLSLVNNSTFDISSARFALSTLIKICGILGTEQGRGEGVERWSAMLNQFPSYMVNDDGALKEWAWEGLEDNYGHRHSSHLVGVWPYREITPEADEDLYDAALVALKKRDAHYTGLQGHGVIHDALIAANLKNASSLAYRLRQITTEDFYYDGLISSHDGGHKTFCTDTCNTLPAIMMEMLISSDAGMLEFLPALVDGLDTGSVSGVKGRNQTTIENLSWDRQAKIVTATVRSDIDQTLTVIERQGIVKMDTAAPVRHSSLGRIARDVTLTAGESTTIVMHLDDVDEAAGNLALGKPAVASSIDDPTRTADQAVDGNYSSRWSSGQFDNSWIYVDLGQAYSLTAVVLEWEAAYAKAYKLQVADDPAGPWTDIYETDNGKGGSETMPVKGAGRYVRMLGSERVVVNGSKWGYSLYEFEVYGQSPSKDGNIARYRPVTATSQADEAHSADKALDGDHATSWRSGREAVSSLVIDLGEEYKLSGLTLVWGEPYAAAYTVQVSGDKYSWNDAYTTAKGSGGSEKVALDAAGRYLRLQMTASSGEGFELMECEAEGETTAPPPADKTALKEAIAYPITQEVYTPASLEAYREALEAARAVAADKKALQSAVDGALATLLQARQRLERRYLGETIGRFPASGKTYTANKSVLGSDTIMAEEPINLRGRDLSRLYILMTVTLTNDSVTEDGAAFATGKLRFGSPDINGQKNDIAYDIAGMKLALHKGENLLYFPIADTATGYFETGDGEINWSRLDRFRMYIDSLNQYPGSFTMTIGDILILDSDAVKQGDINGDGEVAAEDALMALQAATQKITLTDRQKRTADVNGKDGVTSADALLILQYATKKITGF